MVIDGDEEDENDEDEREEEEDIVYRTLWKSHQCSVVAIILPTMTSGTNSLRSVTLYG